MKCYDNIEKLIEMYKQQLHDHQIPIEMTVREQYRMQGADATLRQVIYDLNWLIKDCREINHNKNYFTE